MRELAGRQRTVAFFVTSYAIFWIMLGATGAAMALGAPAWLQQVLKSLDSWAPTAAILVLFKRLLPGTSLGAWLRGAFSSKAGAGDFLKPLLIQLLAFAAALGLYLLFTGAAGQPLALRPLSALPLAFLITLTAGPLGEELGWRAFAYGGMRERGSPAKVALLLGLAWGFWHLPLWLLSGYTGMRLLAYVAAFLVAIVSTSVIVARFYERSRNVVVAMWIHFWFNFLLQLVSADLLPLLACLSVVYAACAALILASGALKEGKPRTGKAEA